MVVLFKAHTSSNTNLIRCKACGDNAVMLFDHTNNKFEFADIPHTLFTVSDLARDGFVLRDSGWGPYGYRGPLWWSVEHPVVWYYRRFPDHDYYWAIEYDVVFTGQWASFFNHFSTSTADLIGAWHNVAYERFGDWKTESLNFPTHPKERETMLLCVARYSNNALSILDREYRCGKTGFCEIIVPTLIKQNCGTLLDINSANTFYDLTTFIPGRNGIPLSKKNTLYHGYK